MSKVAIVILTDIEGGEAVGRVVNALTAAKEFKDGGDHVQVIFSGTGTKWVSVLAKPNHMLNKTYVELKSNIKGACGFCATAFGVADEIQAEGVCMLNEFGTNMSFRELVNDGYLILNF